jgi:hypothetical protein
MLTHVVHVVTNGLINVHSDEELTLSARTWMFRASVTILMSTNGIHKDFLWFPSLKLNIYISPPPPPSHFPHYNRYLNHISSIYWRASCKLLVSKYLTSAVKSLILYPHSDSNCFLQNICVLKNFHA